jgi:hypothetical protein
MSITLLSFPPLSSDLNSRLKSTLQQSRPKWWSATTGIGKKRRGFRQDSVSVKAEGISWPAGVQRPKPLSDSMLGPFRVTKGNEAEWPRVGLNVDLDLPPSLSKVHPTFHVEKLEPFKDQFPDRVQYTPAPVARAGHWVAEVEKILDHRYSNNQLQYLIKFVGYPISEAEWHTYTADDPSWEDDIGLVVAYQSTHGLPPRPPGRRHKGFVASSGPSPLSTPVPSTLP